MRYFVPVLRLSAELPPQSSPEDKLGGLPWGIPANSWPTCRQCGTPQALLAQFIHHPARINLGRTGRLLSVFQCNNPGVCATWEGGSGANACLITEPEDLSDAITALPEGSLQVEVEARIVEWLERDDGIDQATVSRFFSSSAFHELSETQIARVSWSTRLGGVPRWIQSPDEAPPADCWRFIGQLDSTYSFQHAPSVEDARIMADDEYWEGRSHYCEGPNFGDGGIAYLFLREGSAKPEGWFFWQCC